MEQDILIKFINVDKSYDDENLIVDKLNLDIVRGEFLTMLGPSGSGKTTCLMMLAGFENVSGGEIYIDDNPIANTPSYKRNIGMVFQQYALFPHMTVAQNLAYPLKFRNLDKKTIASRVDKFLELVKLSDFSNRNPAQLSGGQQQRVALARALIYKPEIVLMDEPLGALDKNLREEMQYEIKKLHEILGFTAIYVTHDQTEALTMSDRVVIFNKGIVQQISDTKTIYNKPKNSFVADFIGENNHLSGTVTKILDDNKAIVSLTNNTDITVSNNDNSLLNKKVNIFIRPEDIIIQTNNNSIDYNCINAIITDIIFVGDYTRIRVSVFDEFSFMIKHLEQDDSNFKINDSIYLLFLSDNCLALI